MDIRRTVLLADANEEFRAMLREAMEKNGEFTVTASAGDGAEALRLAEQYRPDLVVTDVVYAPPETKMLREARAAGCKTCDGLGMLLCQGAEAFRLYSGLEMPVEEIRALLYT